MFENFSIAQFKELKKEMKMLHPIPDSTQDLIEVKKIAANGIFELASSGAEKVFSKTYRIVDINYITGSKNEQIAMFSIWCQVINSFDIAFKITIYNKNRNMHHFRENIMYPLAKDRYDAFRQAFNDIMETKILDGKQGIVQEKYLTVIIKRGSYEEAKAAFATLDVTVEKSFDSIGSSVVSLDAKERLRLFHDFYRVGSEEDFSFTYKKNITQGMDWRNDIACNEFREYPDHVETDRKYIKALYLSKYPQTLSDEFLDKFTNLPICSIFSIDYVPIPKDVVNRVLEIKYMGVEKEIQRQQQKRNANRDFSSDISYKVKRQQKVITKMMEDVLENDQNMFWVGLNFVFMADTKEQMQSYVSTAENLAKTHSCRISVHNGRQRQAINTVLPYGVRQVSQMRTMLTQTAGALMPFKVQELQQDYKPFYYGMNKISKNIILANRKLLMNGNGFVFGVPGCGKSFNGGKMEMASVFLNTKDDIIVVDPTLEYFDVADVFDGTQINMATYTKNFINPLEVDINELDVEDRNGLIADKCVFLLAFCEKSMEGNLTIYHKSIIDRCARSMYLDIAKRPKEERRVPVIQDFYELLKKQPEREAKEICLALEIFITGSLNIFNHDTNVDTENRVTVYGIRDMDEELAGVSMLAILENISVRIQRNAVKGIATWLYVDEFHVVMDKEFTKKYFIALWKKVRKLGGMCTGLTQNVVDVLKDKETSTLVSNSEYTLFLKQGDPDQEAILKTFGGISPAQMKYVTNVEPGTGLFRFGSTVIPYDNAIDKTNLIYDIFNTNLHEKVELKKKQQGITDWRL